MAYTYRVLIDADEFRELYRRMKAERLLWSMFPELDYGQWSEEAAVAYFAQPNLLTLGGYIDGELAGFLTLAPTRTVGRCCEVALLAFRAHFRDAITLCKGALAWVLATQNIDSLVGYIPKPSRHSLRLIGQVGFTALGEVPGWTWYTRLQKFVPAVVVAATRQSLQEATDGWWRRIYTSGGGTDPGEATNKKHKPERDGGDRRAAQAGAAEPGTGGEHFDGPERADFVDGRQ